MPKKEKSDAQTLQYVCDDVQVVGPECVANWMRQDITLKVSISDAHSMVTGEIIFRISIKEMLEGGISGRFTRDGKTRKITLYYDDNKENGIVLIT
jgi:hypothetical protein